MSYLASVANQQPMFRVAGKIFLAFFCASPVVLLFSSLVAHAARSLLQ
jgi:hypothetical protein